MAIYDRSNIDYSGMIRDMIDARTAGAKIAADNIRRQGELWGNFAKDIGGVASRTWDAAHLNDTDMPGIANYVAFGDSSLLDRQLAEAAARHQMAEQQAFQAEEAIKNRDLQEKIASMNKESSSDIIDKKARESLKQNMELEMAQAEYDAAMEALDSQDPRTALAAKKAAIKLNYALRGKYADEPQLNELLVDTNYDGKDSVRIANKRESDSLANSMDSILGLKGTKAWNNERAAEFNKYLERMQEIDPERAKGYAKEKFNKGKTSDDIEAAYQAELKAAGNNAAKIRQVKKKYGRK